MDENKFEAWAIVELFGRQKIVGKVSEQQIAGTNMLRVDVPEIPAREAQGYMSAQPVIPGYTRFFGSGAIYAINPVSEEVARQAAAAYRVEPVIPFEIRRQALEHAGASTSEIRDALGQSDPEVVDADFD